MDTLFNYVTMQIRALNPNLQDHNYARYTGFGTSLNNFLVGSPPDPITDTYVFENAYSFPVSENKPLTIAHHGLINGSFVINEPVRFPVGVDFSFEFKVYLTNSATNTGLKTLVDNLTGGQGFNISVNLTTGFIIVIFNGVTLFNINVNFQTLTKYHISFSRKNNIFKLFINGVEVGINSSNTSLGNTYTSSVTSLTFGGKYLSRTPAEDCDGFFDDIRVTKNIARYYDNNFTPPLSSEYEFGYQRNGNLLNVGFKEFVNTYKIPFKNPQIVFTDNFLFSEILTTVKVDFDKLITTLQTNDNGIIEGFTSRDNNPQREQVALLTRYGLSLLKRKLSDTNGKYVFRNLNLDPDYLLLSQDQPSSLPRKNAAVRDFARCYPTIKFENQEIEITQGITSPPISVKGYNFKDNVILTLSCSDPSVTIFPTEIKVSPTSYNHLITITSSTTGVKQIEITPNVIFPPIDPLMVTVVEP